MKVDLSKFNAIDILVDENKNIAAFPSGSYEDRKYIEDGKVRVYVPIELKNPYTVNELADVIKQAMLSEDNELFFIYDQNKNKTYEEVYYGIKGFKNAMKGKKLIDLGWNDRWGKYVSLMLPDKRVYSYTGVKLLYLDDSADWIDFAEAVLSLIDINSENKR